MSWLFPAYLAVVFTGLILHKRYRRRHPAKPPQTIHGQIFLGLGKAGVALAIVYFGFMAAFISLLITDYFLVFTPSRIDIVEERTGIIIGDDITPVKYAFYSGGQGGSIQKLTLKTELDSSDFMEKCCAGEIVEYTENGMVYSIESGRSVTLEEYGLSDCTAFYLYKYKNHRYRVKFKPDGTVLIC